MEHIYDIKDSDLEEIELKKKSSKNESVDNSEINEDEISENFNDTLKKKKKIKSNSNAIDFDETETNLPIEDELISVDDKIKYDNKKSYLGRKRKRKKSIVRKIPKNNSGSFAGDYLARPFATGLGAGVPIAAVSVPILLILSNKISSATNTLKNTADTFKNTAENINKLGTDARALVQNANDKLNKIGNDENIANLGLIFGHTGSLMGKVDNQIFDKKNIDNVKGTFSNSNQIRNQVNNLRNNNNNNNIQSSNIVSKLERLNNGYLSEENVNSLSRGLGAVASIVEKLDKDVGSPDNLNLFNNMIASVASLANKTNNLLNNENVNNINIIKNTINRLMPEESNNIKKDNDPFSQSRQLAMEEKSNDKQDIGNVMSNVANNVNNFLVNTNNFISNVNNLVVKFEDLVNENKKLAEFIGKVLRQDPNTINMLKDMKENIQGIVKWIDDNHSVNVKIPGFQNEKLHVKFHKPGCKEWWMGRTGFVLMGNVGTTNKQAYLRQVINMITDGLNELRIEFDSECPQDKKIGINAKNIYFSDTVAELFGSFVYNTNKSCEDRPILAANLQAIQNVLETILPIVLGDSWITKPLINLISWLANTKYIEDGDGFCLGQVGTGTFKRFTMLGGTIPTGLSSTASDFLYNGINEASKQNITKERIDKVTNIYKKVLEVLGIETTGLAPEFFAVLTVMCFPMSESN